MTVSEKLKQTWSSVAAEAPQIDGYYRRRIPVVSVWPVHAGIHRPTGSRILILETETRALRGLRLKDDTKGYLIDVGPDDAGRDNQATIRIQETSSAYREIFTIFCADILEHWIPHACVSDSLSSLCQRLARWKKFFQRGSQLGLSKEDHIGLYGELSFMEAGLSAGIPTTTLVNGWQAPLASNQDYLFGLAAVEIKTITSNDVDRVRITNARQLDSAGLQRLFLVRYAFDFRQGAGRTLSQLVVDLRSSLGALSPELIFVFDDRLLDAGFVQGTPNEFDDWGFTVRCIDFFSVVDGFPRLLEADLPSGVSEISYNLNLSAAAQFKIGEADFWSDFVSHE